MIGYQKVTSLFAPDEDSAQAATPRVAGRARRPCFPRVRRAARARFGYHDGVMNLCRALLVLVCANLALGCSPHESPPPAAKRSSSAQVEWVAVSALQTGPIRHDALAPEQLARIKHLQTIFAEVDPTPLDKWVDDFRRDTDPEREIRIYESMAHAYDAYVSSRTLSLAAKREVYQLVLLRSGASDEDVLQHAKLEVLSPDDAKEVLRNYTAPPVPVTITTTTP